jgi:DNA topoisomerase-1
MSKTLVIVESPGKISKISQYLGSDYIVKASFGHVQDLDKETLSIEVENNFNPLYKVSPDKTKVVKELKGLAKDCKEVILAADGDREGEAIAYSLANVLKLKDPKRIVFNEITKSALLKAVQNPSTINYNMVHAQQARRLLDRLVGYLISPVLWKYLVYNGSVQSAGRVQSVVVRIIADKEEEINKSISSPYYKTTIEYKLEDDSKLNGTLKYEFENEEKSREFLSQINKKTVFKVVSVKNSTSIRKPSPPFITSSLQQEASTKLHFSVKKTMDVAQKLYEAGHITYMRSDSPNISKVAIEEAKKYIVETWGQEYSEPKNYESKNDASQDAHECIRPTHLDVMEPDKVEGDQLRLYSLIWKRTIASQMAPAKVNVQTILSDALNNKQSILVFNNNTTHFNSVLENVEFPGYMIVYNNNGYMVNEDSEQPVVGKVVLKEKDQINMNKLKVSVEYTKPPLRYNEASLVRYLEKNGIGRPSTYASIISKVIDRNYVEVKNVEGVKKESLQLELSSTFKLKESVKEVCIGKEQKKLVPTPIGIQVNEFMMKNFTNIMDIDYTATLESYLDKIAEGKANWVTILRNFYDQFHPIVEKMMSEAKVKKEKIGSSSDRLLGTHNGNEVYCGSGKYGPYVKLCVKDKPRYAPLKDIKLDDVTLENAIKLLEYPITLGKIGPSIVTLCKGPYGLYIKCSGKNYSIKDESDDIDLDYAKQIIESGDKYALKSFKVKDKVINVKKGESNYYLQIVSGSKKQNIPIPNKIEAENITLEQVLEIISVKNGTTKKVKKEITV